MKDQAESLRLRLKKLKEKTETKAIAVLSGKGGVGKSNFALNFAINLSKKGHNVLLCDLDVGMGNIDILMGVNPQNSIVDIFEKGVSIQEILKKGPHNLSYISGGTGLSKVFTMDQTKFAIFIDELQKLLKDYDYLIFDMGAGISEDTLHFLLSVHDIFIITTPEPTAITDAYATMKYIYVMDKNAPFYLVVNRAQTEKEGNATLKRLSNAMNQFLKKETSLLGLLPEDKVVAKAVSSQTPFCIYEPKANVSRAIEEITERYVNKTYDHKETESRSFSFISRLRQFFTER